MTSISIGRSSPTPVSKRILTSQERSILSQISGGNWNDNFSGNYNMDYLLESLSLLNQLNHLLEQYANNNRAGFYSHLITLATKSKELSKFHYSSGLQKVDISKIAEHSEAVQAIVNNVKNKQEEVSNTGGAMGLFGKIPLLGGTIKKIFNNVGSSVDTIAAEEILKQAKEDINKRVEDIEELRNQISLENAKVSDAINQNVMSYMFLEKYAFPYYDGIQKELFEQIQAASGIRLEDNVDCLKFVETYKGISNNIFNVRANAGDLATSIPKEQKTIEEAVKALMDSVDDFNNQFGSNIRDLRLATMLQTVTEHTKVTAEVGGSIGIIRDMAQQQSKQNLEQTIAAKQEEFERQQAKARLDQEFEQDIRDKLVTISQLGEAISEVRLASTEEALNDLQRKLSVSETPVNADPVNIDLNGKIKIQ